MNQEKLNNLAENLQIKYKVIDNLRDGKKTYRARITLTNNSEFELGYDNWEIHFCHIRMVEPGHLPKSDHVKNHNAGIQFTHINGGLFKMSPLKSFETLKKGDKLEIEFKGQHYAVAKTDFLPNWYFTYPKLEPVVIKSTTGEDLSFVEDFETKESWKRFDYELDDGKRRFDHYNPFNLQERFNKNKCEPVSSSDINQAVIPTPLHAIFEDKSIEFKTDEWIIIADDACEDNAKYLSEKINIPVGEEGSKKIDLKLCEDLSIGDVKSGAESYILIIQENNPSITITASDQQGLFYGIQTLRSLICSNQNNSLPICNIKDTPRYEYRGMHLDVSRNFHTKEEVFKLLEAMAMYKMNKFHFHLTDDEGWRIEIPGLEELVTVGSKRGHIPNFKDKTEIKSLLPLLGSGPGFNTSGTGYYSIKDYKEILEFAKQHYIEVIPEIDMPGHSHSAIQAMKARYYRFMAEGNEEKATEYLLTDLKQDLASASVSVQMFSENAMNPGLESTYRFVRKVVTELKQMHADIMPLKTFHFGGDEVPYEAWEGSKACQGLVDTGKVKGFESLMEYFVTRSANIVAECDLDMGAWQDGVIPDEMEMEPISRNKFKSKNVFVYAWQNVWETGLSGCAYRLANNGYKVVMAQGTHLYFDHPYEPDSEERGLYWACRYMDTRKVFTFMPDNLYANADVKLTGEPLPHDYIEKHKDDHDDLKKPENVIGIQGQLWTELVRTSDQMDYMIFPRLLCVAERGWHKSDWEAESDKESLLICQQKDWSRFAHTLGSKELARLDEMGVAYHLPPPGARCCPDTGKLELNCAYPGLPMFYSKDGGVTWTEYTEKIDVNPDKDLCLCTKSADRNRSSRVVKMKKL